MKFELAASWDDAGASDVRVADLMEKYEIPTTFYWPVEWHSLAYSKGYEPLTFYDAKDIAAQFEIGSHTITHRHLTAISLPDAGLEILSSKRMLERLFGIAEIRKFAPPRGYTNPELTEGTLKVYESQRLTKGPNLVHVHPNSGGNESQPWRKRVDQLVAAGQDIEIWGHSWELDKYDLWSELEDVLRDLRR